MHHIISSIFFFLNANTQKQYTFAFFNLNLLIRFVFNTISVLFIIKYIYVYHLIHHYHSICLFCCYSSHDLWFMIYDLNDCESRIPESPIANSPARPAGIPAGIANSGSRVTSGLPLRCALHLAGTQWRYLTERMILLNLIVYRKRSKSHRFEACDIWSIEKLS